MKLKFSPLTKFLLWSVAGIAGALLLNDRWNEMEVEHVGTVIDVTNGKPLEGAFVLAEYREAAGTLFGHSSSWCVSTRGMYTGPDGKFSFPGRRAAGPPISAIKPEYFETLAWHYAQNGLPPRQESPSDRYLQPQDPGNPQFPSIPYCERPRSSQDAAANVVFLKIVLAERLRYGDSNARVSNLLEIIKDLESTRPRDWNSNR